MAAKIVDHRVGPGTPGIINDPHLDGITLHVLHQDMIRIGGFKQLARRVAAPPLHHPDRRRIVPAHFPLDGPGAFGQIQAGRLSTFVEEIAAIVFGLAIKPIVLGIP